MTIICSQHGPYLSGHVGVVGLLLSRSTDLLKVFFFLSSLFAQQPPQGGRRRWSDSDPRGSKQWPLRDVPGGQDCARWARFCQVPLTNCWLKWLFQVRRAPCQATDMSPPPGSSWTRSGCRGRRSGAVERLTLCGQGDQKYICACKSCDQGGFLQVVVLLTNAGSTTTEKTSTGKTPLWYACIDQHKGCVEFLLR